MSDKPTDKELGQAALAQLTKSALRTTPQKQGAELRDQQLRSLDIYKNPRHSTETGSETSPASATLMEKLWVMMAGLYGHKWISSYGTSDIKLDDAGNPRPDSGIWGKALAGISGQQIAHGMKLCTLRTGEQAAWPPSAPEFRDMCLAGQSAHGIPDVTAAWREAVEASTDPMNWKFSHPIVQEAARLTDWYSIRTGTPKAETVQNRFNKRYADLVAKLNRGEPLVDGQLQIGHDEAQSLLEKSDHANDWLVKQRIKDQGLDAKSPGELRAELLAKMGIKR
jgi:hypothetical protein